MSSKSDHWNEVYAKRPTTEVSWFQAEAQLSVELVEACDVPLEARIIDVGAGASTFADGLIARGYSDITLLDIAEKAFDATRTRLPDAPVHYLVADVTSWHPDRTYQLWHDRAVFHFLIEESQRRAYRNALSEAVPVGGHVIMGTFAMDGPERCSNLPVQRYSTATLALELSSILQPVEDRSERHATPSGSQQPFIFVRFVRV